jgi:hypothetical protein
LVDAHLQEESGEGVQRRLAEVAAAIAVAAAYLVALGQVLLVFCLTVRETARNRPQAACIKRAKQRGIGHQPGNAAIPIGKRMDVEETVVRGTGGKYRFKGA